MEEFLHESIFSRLMCMEKHVILKYLSSFSLGPRHWTPSVSLALTPHVQKRVIFFQLLICPSRHFWHEVCYCEIGNFSEISNFSEILIYYIIYYYFVKFKKFVENFIHVSQMCLLGHGYLHVITN